MYENAFNSIERELRNEDGIANELDYVEQCLTSAPMGLI
jgi:type I restriction enzyme M protein